MTDFDELALAVMTTEEITNLIDNLTTILNQKGVVKNVDDTVLGDATGVLSMLITEL